MMIETDDLAMIGERVDAARRERGLSYHAVAVQTGMSVATVHKVVHGGNPRLRTIITLLRWLDD